MSRTLDLLERISALHRALMRKFAQDWGVQLVHVEVVHYLNRCNRYSDTTQALSEYLGQTKGSISQTIGFLEAEGYLKRIQDKTDKRVFHLHLLAKGRSLAREFEKLFSFPPNFFEDDLSLERVLVHLQKANSLKSFDLCKTCRFNSNPSGSSFVCGLTGEKLSHEDVGKICREHQPITG